MESNYSMTTKQSAVYEDMKNDICIEDFATMMKRNQRLGDFLELEDKLYSELLKLEPLLKRRNELIREDNRLIKFELFRLHFCLDDTEKK